LEHSSYNADNFVDDKPHLRGAVRPAFREMADDGYMIVYQDVRGKYRWMGDDGYHYRAFRQNNLDYFTG
jgi:predicted acyl esterase